MLKKISVTLLGMLIIYTGASFAMKASIGICPVDAAIASFAALTGMKIGSFSMLFHGSFFLGQIVLERRAFKKTEFLQIPYIILGGYIMNFFLYTVLANVEFNSYLLRFVVCLLSFVVCSLGCILVMDAHLMRIPVEGFVQILADRTGITLGKMKQRSDFLLILCCVAVTLIFGIAWTLREGTILSAIVFGPLMDFWRRVLRLNK